METPASATYPAGIGRVNRTYLERLHQELAGAFDVDHAAEVLGLGAERTRNLLAYLTRRGWVSRVRRGLYVAVPLDARRSGEWTEDSWVVAERAFGPCYIGGWSACEHWGLTDQTFRTLLVVTARKVRDREPVIQGLPYRLTVRQDEKLFGTRPVWRGQVRVEVSDPSRTIIDVLDDPTLGGGMRHVAEVVEEYFVGGYRDDDSLTSYGDRYGNRAVFKRLGYLVERLGVDAPDLVRACLTRRSAGLAALDPSIQTQGRIVRRWRLRVNAEVRHMETLG